MDRAVYAVKEVYLTLQGEGARTGRPAVFCRFAGCNLWSGLERDRARAACYFCDTDFVGIDGPGGGRFADAAELARVIAACWQPAATPPYVVFTGGEPLLQLDAALVDACHREGFEVAIETNGTLPVPPGVDWLCVSPKPNSHWIVREGHELKLVYPMEVGPEGLDKLPFEHFFLQPLDGPDLEHNTRLAEAYGRQHPPWKVSLQTHKLLGIP
jgi:7-carboxy-7-deazaguanine synthase (Cx14CxxC type)